MFSGQRVKGSCRLQGSHRRDAAMDYDSLIDAKVQIRGNAVPVFNGYLQMVGARILFPSHEVRVVQLALPDPFSTPVIPVARLLWFSPGVVLRHRAHIQGTVTPHWPGRMSCMQKSYRIRLPSKSEQRPSSEIKRTLQPCSVLERQFQAQLHRAATTGADDRV